MVKLIRGTCDGRSKAPQPLMVSSDDYDTIADFGAIRTEI